MANRYPLILDSSNNKIKELPDGDNLDLTGAGISSVSSVSVGTAVTIGAYGIHATGVVTATSFTGDGSGLTGVASTDNIRTATKATFLSDISVAGVITATGGVIGNLTGTATTATNLADAANITTGTISINRLGSSGTKDATTFLRGDNTFAVVDSTSLKDSGGNVKAQANPNGVVVTGILTATSFEGFDSLSAPFGSTVTFTVTVASKTSSHRYNGSGSSNGYLIDGVEAAFLTLTPGRTYRFDQSDSSNSSHPLRFYLEADKTTAYTTNVTTSGTPGSDGYTEITVSDSTPQILHYQCSSHSLMGNSVSTSSNIAGGFNVVDESSDTSCNVLFTTDATGTALEAKTGTNLTFNSSSGALTATSFVGDVTGDVTGNADTATTLETARSIGGVSFNGSADINLPGVNASGNQDTSGTAAVATNITVADESSDTSCNVLFTTAATGNLAPKSGTNLTFNSSSGALTATSFATGAEGSSIIVNSATITGPSSITIDPDGVGDNTGTVHILGDLQVEGTTTTIDSTTVNIADKNIQVATGAANDAAANGAGFTIDSGDGDKTFQFEATGDNFGSSENLNLASSKTYKINNTDVLSATTLGSAVVNSSLTSVGTLNSLDVSGALTGAHANLSGVVTANSYRGDGSQLTGITAEGTGAIGGLTIKNQNGVTVGTAGSVATLDFDGSSGVTVTASSGSSGISTIVISAELVTDTSPQLGGNLDINGKNITGTGNINLTGIVTATSFVGDITGNADTATTLETARNIGGVSFDGSANINLPGVNASGNQDTSGTAAVATNVTVADESSDTTCFPLFTTAATGDLAPKSGTNLTFNSSSGALTATSFSGNGASLTSLNGSNISSGTIAAGRVATLNQDTTGNAATATTLETARNIGGVSFDGSSNINLPGVNQAGNQNTSGTAAVATNVTVADESSDTSCNVLFTTSATGNLAPKSGTNLTFNSSSGQLTATSFSGNGASLTSLNASNISSGTIAAGRVATLNQDTTGTATNATNFNVAADNSTNSDHYIIFTGGATGNQRPNSDTALKYNPSSNTLTAGNFNSTSDIALKDNVNIIDNAADMIKNLQGIRWNWKQNGAASLGVSAQNVETVAPELVTNGDDYKSVNYNGLIGILIEAVKEQGNQINDLKQVITELKGKS